MWWLLLLPYALNRVPGGLTPQPSPGYTSPSRNQTLYEELASDFSDEVELGGQAQNVPDISSVTTAAREELVFDTIASLGGTGESGQTPAGTVQQYFNEATGQFGVRVAYIDKSGNWAFDYVG